MTTENDLLAQLKALQAAMSAEMLDNERFLSRFDVEETRFTLLKIYPDRSRHVAHLPHSDIEAYKAEIDAADGDIGGEWVILPLEEAEKRPHEPRTRPETRAKTF